MANSEDQSNPSGLDREYDVHGFMISSDEENDRCHGCRSSSDDGDLLAEKWQNYCSEESSTISFPEVRKLIKKGIPKTLRGEVWKRMLRAHKVKEKHSESFHYQEKLQQLYQRLQEMGLCQDGHRTVLSVLAKQIDNAVNSADEMAPGDVDLLKTMRQILMDVDRTFVGHCTFTSDTCYWSLFHVLLAYAQFNPTIGYCQGMAYVAAILRMYIDDEEDVFWCLLSLLESEDHLHLFYERTLKKVKVYAELFRSLLGDHLPQLHKHLESLEIHPLMFFTQWMMGLFSGLSCWDSVLLICDLFFMEGSYQLLNAALALMEVCMPEMLAMDRLEHVLPFIQNIPSRLIHRKSLQPLLFSQSMLKSQEELSSRLKYAEQRVFGEDQELQQIKENYLQKKGQKRHLTDEEGVDGVPVQSAGLLSRIARVFTPAKRMRFDSNQPTPAITSLSMTTQPAAKTPVRTEYTFSRNPQTPYLMSTMPKSAVTSIKKGHGQVFFTPDSGLIYTSPNTIEMGDLTKDPGSGRRRSKRARRVIEKGGKNSAATSVEVVKLTFDLPEEERGGNVRATRKKALTANTESHYTFLSEVKELDSPANKLFTSV